MFIDRIKVFAQAGSGGRGSVSFRREKFVPKGGHDGGDGGRGGDVILRADRHVDNLSNLFYEPIIKAKSGGHGMGKKMHGKSAPAKSVKVPVGTIVWPADEKGRPTSAAPIVDLTQDGEEFVLCRGGAGGKGNVHFKSSRNRAPRQYTEGEEGEAGHFSLELRTIADAGLVGYPNAGKSTLVRQISARRPKLPAYPFTICCCRSVHGLLLRTKWICRARKKILAACARNSRRSTSSRFRRRKARGLRS